MRIITLTIPQELLDKVDKACNTIYENRSEFIRNALKDRLRKVGKSEVKSS